MVDVDIDPERPRRVLAVAILFLCLTPVAVALRLYSKIFVTRAVTADDKILCLLQVVFTTFLVTEILGVVHGTGRDATELSPEDRRAALKFFFAGELLYVVTTILLKVCVGVLLLRIAIVPRHIWLLRLLLLSTLVFGVMYLFLVGFQCKPVYIFWDQGPRTPGHCFSRDIVLGTTFTATTLNCIADWAFGILPLFIVWSLGLRTKTKILVVILLGFASIASIATIIRAVTVPSVLSKDNFLRETANFALWSTVEPGIGITAACAPSLTPLVRKLRGKLKREGASDRGIWRTRPLPTIPFSGATISMSKKYAKASLSRSDPPSSMEMPRLRFDDFTYESRISGPQSLRSGRRPGPPRSRASWTFPMRAGTGSSAASAAGSEVSHQSTPSQSSAVSAGGSPLLEPPAEGIMKTMEFELSYEARTWAGREAKTPLDDRLLRPCVLAEMRRLTSGEASLLHVSNGGLSPLSAEFDLESGFPLTTFRHSAPPEASWRWAEDTGQEDEAGLSCPTPAFLDARDSNGQLGDS
ncbi:integral membrane protein [Colletotrichum musicola]|uniref:Integral membrane protein n=1 Tax=Colletotrichum musicola TaxID=2175873 RepID=A0A8H6NZP3_9PEZI|nr:integral membrane protein [Colletotrichum musicola]